jgi:hypothetical protein
MGHLSDTRVFTKSILGIIPKPSAIDVAYSKFDISTSHKKKLDIVKSESSPGK